MYLKGSNFVLKKVVEFITTHKVEQYNSLSLFKNSA